MSTQRSGILAAGNFIVDNVKIIDAYPELDMLASILSESLPSDVARTTARRKNPAA